MAGYSTRVKRDIARWVENGFIDASTGTILATDVEANERRFLSFGNILAIMAALLFSAAILIFVAANWEMIPRLARVLLLFAVIATGYIGGALLKLRDHDALAQALWLIAAAAFGGSIALIGQMYHLSGDEASAIIVWLLGTALAAILLRSGPLTVASAGIAMAWLFVSEISIWDYNPLSHLYLLLAAGVWLISYWTQSRAARHVILLSLIFYMAFLAAAHDLIPIAAALSVISVLVFIASVYLPEQVEKIVRLDGGLPIHGLLGFLTGMAIIQIDQVDETASLVVTALVVFAGTAAAVVLAGRESRALRWLAYLGFSLELCFVYGVMMGTMLGTAGLFLASGLVLGLAAYIIIRIEKRMKTPAAAGGAA
ncbi:DUF2157 domain-containing protein [Mesorhizobium sp. SB112]|uniref:DUF2157 domain-containing protein n=1 Tax=Mesorhizobium sp. SB112 TaxID=3151853 RepID=UPI003264FE0E